MTDTESRRRGGGQPEVPVIGLGCMVMPGFYGPGSEEPAIARAISMGQYQGPF